MDRPKWPKYRDHLKAHRFWSILNALFCTLMYIYIYTLIIFDGDLFHFASPSQTPTLLTEPSALHPHIQRPIAAEAEAAVEAVQLRWWNTFHDLPWQCLAWSDFLAVSRSASILSTHTHTCTHTHLRACMIYVYGILYVCTYDIYIYISYCDVKININKLYIELLCYIINSTYYRISTPPAAWT